jgi:hypothetical protein
MHRTHHRHAAAHHWHSRQAALEAIEWEELPSLAASLRSREFAASGGHVWPSTERLDLPAEVPTPAPFVESINGLHVREIANEEVFRHFFGDPRANH